MASQTSVSTPPSQAGIFGVSVGTNAMGWKFSPRAVVVIAILMIVLIKVLDFVVYRNGI
jgi:preprotein translocase subunit Sec61beta